MRAAKTKYLSFYADPEFVRRIESVNGRPKQRGRTIRELIEIGLKQKEKELRERAQNEAKPVRT